MEPDQIQEENSLNGLRRIRVKSRSKGKKKGGNPLILFGPDILLFLALLLGIVLLFNWPALYEQINNRWLAYLVEFFIGSQTKPFVAGGLLVVGLLGGFLRLRWRINYNPRYWHNHCPNCGKSGDNLHRSRRNGFDRLVGQFGFPVRRYICHSCHWTGPRIDETRI